MLYTNYQQLTLAVQFVLYSWLSHQQHHHSGLAEFLSDVICLPSSESTVADCLSLSLISTASLGVDYQDLAAQQLSSPNVSAYCPTLTGMDLQNVILAHELPSLLCDVAHRKPCTIISEGLRQTTFSIVIPMFDTLHGLPHPDVQASQCLTGE